MLALLAGAAALRLDGVRYGLPFALLNPDELSIVPRAWAVVHEGRVDPGWFDYPSLLLYLLAPFQAFADEPSYLAARLPAVALGVAGVAAAWWLGRRSYGLPAAWVAGATTAVATVHVAYSRMAVTDVAVTLGITVALALLLAGRLEWAGVAAGLAASAKYPGVLLVVPLLVAGWGRWRRLAAAAGLAALAFALTSPFVLVRFGEAWEDQRRVSRLAREGWLGFEDDPPTPLAFLDRLWDGVGPLLLVAAVGLALALVRRSRADALLLAFAVAYALTLLPLEAHFDRYVLPLVPVAGALAGRARPLVPLALAALVVPLVWTLADNAELRRPDTRVEAHAWVLRHVEAGTRLAAESSLPPFDGYDVVPLELPHPALPPDPARDVDELRRRGVDVVVVSGAVADRVLAARLRYPEAAAFYEELAQAGELVHRVEPGDRRSGPWVEVRRLYPGAR